MLNNVSFKNDGDWFYFSVGNSWNFFFSKLFSKTLGLVSPVEDEHKDDASLAKDQIEQSRQRLVKLEEDGLEFVWINLIWIELEKFSID